MEENKAERKEAEDKGVFLRLGNYGRAGNHHPKTRRTRHAVRGSDRKIGICKWIVKILAIGGGGQVGDRIRQNASPAPRNRVVCGVAKRRRPGNSEAYIIRTKGVLQEDVADGSGVGGNGDLRSKVAVSGRGQAIVAKGGGLVPGGDEFRRRRK